MSVIAILYIFTLTLMEAIHQEQDIPFPHSLNIETFDRFILADCDTASLRSQYRPLVACRTRIYWSLDSLNTLARLADPKSCVTVLTDSPLMLVILSSIVNPAE